MPLSFSERDVRRHYDLLQHRPELGLTQVKATQGIHLFGVGLFDNEEDFVSECRRYNGLGTITVGVNPREPDLLDQYGGLHNRMRSLFVDVVESSNIHWVTGVVAAGGEPLNDDARAFQAEATRLQDDSVYFALDEAIEVADVQSAEEGLGRWLYGDAGNTVPLIQFAPVMGTALPDSGLFRRRFRFRRYRPYIHGLHLGPEAMAAPGAPESSSDGPARP